MGATRGRGVDAGGEVLAKLTLLCWGQRREQLLFDGAHGATGLVQRRLTGRGELSWARPSLSGAVGRVDPERQRMYLVESASGGYLIDGYDIIG